jgi:type III secretion protein L
MNKKYFFSLINGSTLHIAPKLRVIPKEEFQQLIDGQQLLVEIQQDAERYRQEVATQCEKIKESAQVDGYEEGLKSWLEHIAKLEEEIIKVRKEFEKILIPIAIKAAKKIVGREIELSETTIVDIVSNALKPVVSHKKIIVYVNQKDFDILEKNKPKLKELFELLESFVLRTRADISLGSCVIETEGGIINAQLENQWRTLEKAFDNLVKTKMTQG